MDYLEQIKKQKNNLVDPLINNMDKGNTKSFLTGLSSIVDRYNPNNLDLDDIIRGAEIIGDTKHGQITMDNAKDSLELVKKTFKKSGGGSMSSYLQKISKQIDLSKLDYNDLNKLLDLHQNYNNGTLTLDHAQNVLDMTKKASKSGGKYTLLNKKGGQYLYKIQKEFRNKLNENYNKLIEGGNTKKALKSFNNAGSEFGNKLVDKYLAKLENHAIKGGHPPEVVRNLLTKYGGALPEKLNKLIYKANKKISDDNKKLKMSFNIRDYTGGLNIQAGNPVPAHVAAASSYRTRQLDADVKNIQDNLAAATSTLAQTDRNIGALTPAAVQLRINPDLARYTSRKINDGDVSRGRTFLKLDVSDTESDGESPAFSASRAAASQLREDEERTGFTDNGRRILKPAGTSIDVNTPAPAETPAEVATEAAGIAANVAANALAAAEATPLGTLESARAIEEAVIASNAADIAEDAAIVAKEAPPKEAAAAAADAIDAATVAVTAAENAAAAPPSSDLRAELLKGTEEKSEPAALIDAATTAAVAANSAAETADVLATAAAAPDASPAVVDAAVTAAVAAENAAETADALVAAVPPPSDLTYTDYSPEELDFKIKQEEEEAKYALKSANLSKIANHVLTRGPSYARFLKSMISKQQRSKSPAAVIATPSSDLRAELLKGTEEKSEPAALIDAATAATAAAESAIETAIKLETAAAAPTASSAVVDAAATAAVSAESAAKTADALVSAAIRETAPANTSRISFGQDVPASTRAMILKDTEIDTDDDKKCNGNNRINFSPVINVITNGEEKKNISGPAKVSDLTGPIEIIDKKDNHEIDKMVEVGGNKQDLLKLNQSELENSQEYLNKLNSIIKVLNRRKTSLVFPGIKLSTSYTPQPDIPEIPDIKDDDCDNKDEDGNRCNKCKKCKGEKGPKGDKGDKGDRGDSGHDGYDGHDDHDGNDGFLCNNKTGRGLFCNNRNQNGGEGEENTTTSSDDSEDLYKKKNRLIIENEKIILKKIYNKMQKLDKNNPDYELQLADLNTRYDNINNKIKYLQKLNENPNDSTNVIDIQLIDTENKLYALKQRIRRAEKHILETSPSTYTKLSSQHNNSSGMNDNPNIHGTLPFIQKAGFSTKIDEVNLQDILNESKNIMNFYKKLTT